jgi:hypothetical protein
MAKSLLPTFQEKQTEDRFFWLPTITKEDLEIDLMLINPHHPDLPQI